MALTKINVGTTADDGTGDTIRAAFQLTNTALDAVDAIQTKIDTVEEDADVTDAGNIASSIDSAAAVTTLNDTDKVPVTVAGVLKTIAYSALKTLLNAIYVQTNGALGTPSSGVLTSCSGLPLSTGVTGTLPLANGGTGNSLSDPGADRIGFWDDSAGVFTWLTASTGLTITGTSMTVRSASSTTTGIVELATDAETNTGTDTGLALTPANLAAWTGKTTLTTLGTIVTGVWNGTAIASAYIANAAITLAKMAAGTAGNLISYDAAGNPVAVATGSAGQRLTSAGAGNPPTFQSDALRIPIFFSDQTTDWSTGTKVTFTWRFGTTTLSSTPVDCVTAPTGSAAQFDVKKNGTSIYSTKPTIDAGETSTDTAATPAVLSTTTLSNGDIVTIIIDQFGSAIKGQGGVITFVGTTIP